VKQFKLDENIPVRAKAVLRHAGYDVTTVLEQDLGGVRDALVAAACVCEGRILVTLDLDFADIRSYGSPTSPGIIVIRLPRQDAGLVVTVLARALAELEREPLQGSIWILEPHRVRVWRGDAADR
jgi:predicted nuclease of predicted toxin-antitoxin system